MKIKNIEGLMKLNRILSEVVTNGQNIKECHKEEVKRLIQESEKYLLITEDKSYSSNFKLKFVQLLPVIKINKKLILHPSKFLLLAWQGLLNVYDYDIIIINCEIKMDLVHAFRVFYIDNIAYDCTKPKCCLIIENPKDELALYFQSIINNEEMNSGRANVKCFTIDQNISEDLMTYSKCKRLLIETSSRSNNENFKKLLDTLDKLENENIDEAIELLKKCINSNKAKQIQETDEDLQFCKKLLTYKKKLEKIKEFLKFGPVYVYGNVKIDIENVFNSSTSEINEEILRTSTIIFWDEPKKDLQKFKRKIFFKEHDYYPELFIREICKIDQLDKFLDYTLKRDMEYYTENGKYPIPTLSWEHSTIFFEHIIYQITKLFHDNFLFFRSINVDRTYHNTQAGDKFYSCLNLPKIVDNEEFYKTYTSDNFTAKKDTTKDVNYKVIINLVKTGFLDKNFLPVKSKFIDENKIYLENLKRIYNIDFENIEEAHEQINNLKEEYDESEKFKRDYTFDFAEKDKPMLDIEEVLRKQADVFKNFSDLMSVYIFNNSNIAICTNKSFKETVTYKNTEVAFLKDVAFTDFQKQVILNFQVVFFGVNFRRVTLIMQNIRKYHYFVLPMKNREIDFEYMELIYKNFFIGSVYDVQDRNILNNFLLFNPVTKLFYEYKEESDKKLTDITTQLIKKRNIIENEKVERTFLEYFKALYALNLKNTVDDTNIIFQAIPFSTKKDKDPEFHSGEVLHVTTIRKNIKSDYKRFIEYFNIFETLALAFEFKNQMGFSISLQNLAISFTQKSLSEGDNDLGYERFEFIGDSVLKYSVSKFLFTECGYSLNKLVSTKDSLICNNHLYKIGRKIDIQKYFSFNKYSENHFQPPAILEIIRDKKLSNSSNVEKLINNLNVEKVFLNNNQYNFVREYSKRQAVDADFDKGKKVYADIVESLIGVHYVEEGFDKAWEFIRNIGILENHGNNKNTANGVYLLCDYEGVFPYKSIESVEKIINYTFTNKGYLEKAMIHPSYKNNIFGSERFQKLELVGDCFLDLRVSDYIYFKYTEADPEGLHTHRKRLVNNHTFAMILFKTGLYDLALTGLGEETRNITNNKISKCYSDIFESLAGAVVLDCGFDMKKMDGFFKRALKFMTENTHDC